VALLVCPGCLTHLIVLRFADAFFEHLSTLAPSLGIFIFAEGLCCLPSGRARHGIPTLRFGYGFIKSSTGIRPAKTQGELSCLCQSESIWARPCLRLGNKQLRSASKNPAPPRERC